MKKLFSSVSMVALALCLTAPLAHGMEEENDSRAIQQVPKELWLKISNYDDFKNSYRTLSGVNKFLNETMDEGVLKLSYGQLQKLLSIDYSKFFKFINLQELALGDHNIYDEMIIRFPKLTCLDLNYNFTITGKAFSCLKNIEILKLGNNGKVKNKYLKNLTTLTSLELSYSDEDFSVANKNITDDSLQHLVNLTSLNLFCNENITDNSLSLLTKLEYLNLSNTAKVTGKSVGKLINLMHLNLQNNAMVEGNALIDLTKLTSLGLCGNTIIKDEDVGELTNLTKLNLDSNNLITDNGVANFTNLTELNLTMNTQITDEPVSQFMNLTKLELFSNSKITNEAVSKLTNLTELEIRMSLITGECLKSLPKLIKDKK